MATAEKSRSGVGGRGAAVLAVFVGPHGRPGILAAALVASLVLHAALLGLFTKWQVSERPANPLAEALGRQVPSTLPDMTESQLSGEVRGALTAPALTDDRPLAVSKAPRPAAAVEARRPAPDLSLAAPQPTPRPVPPARLPEPVLTLPEPLPPATPAAPDDAN